MTNRQLTQRMLLYKDIHNKTYDEIADLIGISKPTLFTRKEKHNWKKGERSVIINLPL